MDPEGCIEHNWQGFNETCPECKLWKMEWALRELVEFCLVEDYNGLWISQARSAPVDEDLQLLIEELLGEDLDIGAA